MSWPVANTLMIEPTESESKRELDAFCDALISIRKEISDIENGIAPKTNNLLTNAPHTLQFLLGKSDIPYDRHSAGFPMNLKHKFWPTVGRVDDAFGDRNLMCTCPPLSLYQTKED